MKTLIMLAAAVMVAGCASTPSNVVCNGGSKDMTCHARTAEAVVNSQNAGSSAGSFYFSPKGGTVPSGRHVVDTGR